MTLMISNGSVQATFIRNSLKNGITTSSSAFDQEVIRAAFPPNLIFENPTITSLNLWLESKLLSKEKTLIPDASEQKNRAERMMNMVKKYTKDLPIRGSSKRPSVPKPTRVLLTGSTGSLGSYLLELLIKNPQVEKVWALNRFNLKLSVIERQTNSFRDRGIDITLLESSKLSLLEGDVSQPRFGLSDEFWQEVRLLRVNRSYYLLRSSSYAYLRP
jgi:hypothetical protein